MDARVAVLAIVVLLLASSTATLAGEQATPMLVGFERWPAEALEDGRWANWSVDEGLPNLAVIRVLAEDPDAVRQEAQQRGNVAYVETDDRVRSTLTPDDPLFDNQYPPAQIRLPQAWDLEQGASDVRVAVVDTGVANAHEDLEGAVVAEKDFANGDSTAEDNCGHGTHVAGIAAARLDNGIGIAGTSTTSIVDAKALETDGGLRCSGYDSDVAEAIDWAVDEGSHVVSMSLGGDDASNTIGRALEKAANAGAVLVASAGNDGCGDCVLYPARDDRVIAVACTNDAEDRCDFSSQGPEVELAAPGEEILSTVPGDSYQRASGTSMSAPFVSGTAGLMISENGSLDRTEVRGLLQEAAQDLGPAGWDDAFGYGEVDAETSVIAAAEGEIPNEPPRAEISVDCVSLTCTFSGAASSDPEGDPLTFHWSLSDGAESEQETFTHTFADTTEARAPEGDTHTAQLTVSDGDDEDQATEHVTVRLEIDLRARPVGDGVFGPREQPTVEAKALRLDADAVDGDGVVGDVDVYVTTHWVADDDAFYSGHDGLLGWNTLVSRLAQAEAVYHRTTETTHSSGWTWIEIPGEAGQTLWGPTPPMHRVQAILEAELAGRAYDTSTTYRVSAFS